jgi:hypothetical protein
MQHRLLVGDRQIGDLALVAAVHAPTGCRSPGRPPTAPALARGRAPCVRSL